MQDPFLTAAIVALAFLVAGTVKGVVGMGLPAVAIGVLGLAMAPAQAAALLIVPSLVTNVWQLAAGPSLGPLTRRFAVLMIGVCAGTALGIGLLTSGNMVLASAALGTALALYGAYGLLSPRPRVSPHAERWLSPIIGLFTGVMTGATGVFAIPAVPYFSALGLEKDELTQTLGLLFTVCTIALAVGLMAHARFVPRVRRDGVAPGARSHARGHGARAASAQPTRARSVPPLVLRRARRPGCICGAACAGAGPRVT